MPEDHQYLSNIDRFRVWKAYRTSGLIVIIAGAVVSMLFSGIIGLVPALAKPDLGEPTSVHQVLMATISVAVCLMLLHAAYLSLMAALLVYRYPIEQVQPIGLVYLLILFAYIAPAIHAALTEPNGTYIEPSWWPGAAFVAAYTILLFHGLRHGHTRSPIQQDHAAWMTWTDGALLVVALVLLGRKLDLVGDWSSTVEAWATNIFGQSVWLDAVHAQMTPKDTFVAVAMLAYTIRSVRLRRALRQKRGALREEVDSHQTFEAEAGSFRELTNAVPGAAVWLDLGSGSGKQLGELLFTAYGSEIAKLAQHAETHDPDRQAVSSQACTEYEPPPSPFPKAVVLVDDRVPTAPAKPANWPKGFEWRFEPKPIESREVSEHVSEAGVIHVSHYAYDVSRVKRVLRALKHARSGTLALLRFTSNVSFYRVVSIATSCSPVRPYTHHCMHALLIDDLLSTGWCRVPGVNDILLVRHCPIEERDVERTTAWVETQYGEFASSVIGRYLSGISCDYRDSGRNEPRQAPNWDRLVLLQRR
jgi:hypothetical protein